ncbi:MAG TPA: ADP-ribosylglycohydrolase family protein [Anaerolineae bacterium]|nr:ADP-ribosylglycohydrolase family protein [Anaerolineae bacterium]
MDAKREDRFKGCLVGLAVGDAVGTTLEFEPRDTYEPLTDMVGGGPFHLPVGAWTDDTSLALCLATSLVEQGEFDAADQISRFIKWWKAGYLSSTGACFDIGNTTIASLERFLHSGEPFSGSTNPHAAGNGSIMRLAPVPMFYANDVEQAVWFSAESSRTTHASAECVDACRLLGAILHTALNGGSKTAILTTTTALTAPKIAAIAAGEYKQKTRDQIRGSGYVVESLEAALWCFHQTDNSRDAILLAANLGDDTDTTAAIVGQVAGAFYGYNAIPKGWREKLVMHAEIVELAMALMPENQT